MCFSAFLHNETAIWESVCLTFQAQIKGSSNSLRDMCFMKTGLRYHRVNQFGVSFSGFPPNLLYGYKTNPFGNVRRVPLLKLHLEQSVVKKKEKKKMEAHFFALSAFRSKLRGGKKESQDVYILFFFPSPSSPQFVLYAYFPFPCLCNTIG